MKFDMSLRAKEYYHTLPQAISHRQTIWENVIPKLRKLEEELFDKFDIEQSIFITEDFFNKNIAKLDTVVVSIKLDEYRCEEVLESLIHERYVDEHLSIIYNMKGTDRFLIHSEGFYSEKSIPILKEEQL